MVEFKSCVNEFVVCQEIYHVVSYIMPEALR